MMKHPQRASAKVVKPRSFQNNTVQLFFPPWLKVHSTVERSLGELHQFSQQAKKKKSGEREH